MNAAEEMPPLSRRQWLGLILGAFLVHLGFIYLFGQRSAGKMTAPPPFQMVLAETAGPALMLNYDFRDPALFALPGRQGFSGHAWMRLPPVTHAFQEWSDEQKWLVPNLADFGRQFVQYVRDISPRPIMMVEKTATPVSTADGQEKPEWLRAESVLRIAGALAGRRLLARPQLPGWPSAEALRSTELQAMVDERGRVFSALILAGSGLAEADQAALNIARELAFEPPGAVTSGRLIFEWNTPSAPPPPSAPTP